MVSKTKFTYYRHSMMCTAWCLSSFPILFVQSVVSFIPFCTAQYIHVCIIRMWQSMLMYCTAGLKWSKHTILLLNMSVLTSTPPLSGLTMSISSNLSMWYFHGRNECACTWYIQCTGMPWCGLLLFQLFVRVASGSYAETQKVTAIRKAYHVRYTHCGKHAHFHALLC